MPFTITEESNGEGVLVTLSGVVDDALVLEAIDGMFAGTQPDRLRYRIWDFLSAELMDVTNEGLQAIAARDQEHCTRARYPRHIVAIVGAEGFFMGADRVYALLAENTLGHLVETFRSMDDARRWLARRTRN